jgi:hypothetical protein
VIYDKKKVKAHYDKNQESVPVLLMNEAPGEQETLNGFPLFGPQGGILYRTFLSLQMNWVVKWASRNPKFRWPVKSKNQYKRLSDNLKKRLKLRTDFLTLRSRYIATTNAFPQWPKSNQKTVNPRKQDVLSQENLQRIQNEVHSIRPRILLICGEFAYLACTGQQLTNTSSMEGTKLNASLTETVNARLSHEFEEVWYLGHTRRWTFENRAQILKTLQNIKTSLKW